jgi:CRP/FNR family cyclic AMP-dependent transcriptional regulator
MTPGKPDRPGAKAGKDIAIWRTFPVFSALEASVLAELPKMALRKSWRAGEMIFAKGDAGTFLIALTDGRIKLSNVTHSGREMVIRFAEPGDLVGEIACLDGGERSSAAYAATDVTALMLTRSQYLDIANRFPALHAAAIAHLGQLLRQTNDRLESVSLYELSGRLARFILFSLTQKHGADLTEVEFLDLALTQTELGLLVGASRSKINAVLQEFREKDVLQRDGLVWRCDVAALRRLADE